MNKVLVIGSIIHSEADTIEWIQAFQNLDNYDSIIIDLSSFPKNFPPNLFNNIGVLKRITRIFIRDYKEIFCIMEKPFSVLFKKIPLNYSWIPFPQNLRVNPMLLGKTIKLTNERFGEYMKNVEKWDNELYWKKTTNIKFTDIAVNKSQIPIAATIKMNNRGKIHFLPKTTMATRFKSIKILIDLATKVGSQEYPWFDSITLPELKINQASQNFTNLEEYRNLFSKDNKKIVLTIQRILYDLGIPTNQTTVSSVAELESNAVKVLIITVKGKIEISDPKISQLVEFIEDPNRRRKLIFIANTYNQFPLNQRIHKQHVDASMKILIETNEVVFMTTFSLFNLWIKVTSHQLSSQETSSLILNEIGIIEI